MRREKIKTLTLAVLFFLSIALVYFNIGNYSPTFDIKAEYIDKSLNVEESLKLVLRPERILIHFGGGNNTEIINNKSEYWKEISEVLKLNLSSDNKLGQIQYKDYLSKKDIKSIELKLCPNINGLIFNGSLGLKNSKLNDIGNISEIVISLIDDKGIYFLTDKNLVYKMQLKEMKNLDMINALEQKIYVKYYTIKNILNINNDTLIPVFDATSDIITNKENINFLYPIIKTKNVFDFHDEKFVQEIAKKILRDKYAFSNKTIETNGMTTYIYAFGENTLRMYPNGYFEYLNESASGKDIGLQEALNSAIRFLLNINVDMKNVYLGDIQEGSIKDEKVYTFGFYYMQGNLRVKINSVNYPIEVKIKGEDVYSYKSLLKDSNYVYNNKEYIINPQEVLNKNYEVFKSDLHYENGEDVLKNIKSVQLMYFLSDNNNFIPVWQFIIGEKVYIFDAYKGENLKYGLGES